MAVHMARWMLASLIVMTVALLGAWSMQATDETKRLLDNFETRHFGDIEVSFHVRSTNGEPLNRVSVRLTKSYLSDAMDDKYDPDRFVVDSEFRVKERGVSAIHLIFLKDGFYTERWEYVMSERPQEILGEVFWIEVEIPMTPHPSPAPLNKYEGPFRSDVGGPISVLSAARMNPPNRTPSLPESLGGTRGAFPEPYVYLDAEVADDGQLSSTLFSMKRFPVPKPVLDRGFLKLVGAKDGDGFLPVDIGQIPAVFEHGFRNLVEAPQAGYSRILELYPVDGREKSFFYCRIGGQFGKGAVTNPPLIIETGGRSVAIANVVIFLNPTGSTDVSYLHH